jgi:peroxiredoxin
MEKQRATIPLLYDRDGSVIRRYGLAFEIPDYLQPAYKTLGFPELNPDTGWTLPIPATYIVATDGTIADRYVNADYTHRMEPADILAALRRYAVVD